VFTPSLNSGGKMAMIGVTTGNLAMALSACKLNLSSEGAMLDRFLIVLLSFLGESLKNLVL